MHEPEDQKALLLYTMCLLTAGEHIGQKRLGVQLTLLAGRGAYLSEASG